MRGLFALAVCATAVAASESMVGDDDGEEKENTIVNFAWDSKNSGGVWSVKGCCIADAQSPSSPKMTDAFLRTDAACGTRMEQIPTKFLDSYLPSRMPLNRQ